MAYKKKNKKPGPVKTTYPYALARQLVQTQGISSKREYARWWNFNLPKGMPKRPDIIYARELGKFSWAEFLGIKNDFPDKKIKFRSYEDCKKFTYALGLRNSLEWFKFCKEKKKPEDIPNAPMHYYSKKGDWVSWKDFLGYDIAKRHEFLVNTKKPMLFIARIPNRPMNVVKINVIMGEKQDLLNYQKANGVSFIRCFYLNRHEDDWFSLVKNELKKYDMGEDDEYFSTNIASVVSELSYTFETIV